MGRECLPGRQLVANFPEDMGAPWLELRQGSHAARKTTRNVASFITLKAGPDKLTIARLWMVTLERARTLSSQQPEDTASCQRARIDRFVDPRSQGWAQKGLSWADIYMIPLFYFVLTSSQVPPKSTHKGL